LLLKTILSPGGAPCVGVDISSKVFPTVRKTILSIGSPSGSILTGEGVVA